MKKNLIISIIVCLFFSVKAYSMPNALTLSVTSKNINIQLIDSFGNITGYDQNTSSIVENIPNTIYMLYGETSADPSYINPKHSRIIENKVSARDTFIKSGKYQLKLLSSNSLEIYSMDIKIYYFIDQGVITVYYPNKIIYPNVVWTYEFDIPVTPQMPSQKIAGISKYTTLPLTKVSTPADLIKDLTTAGQLGYIGNAKFVSEIIKEINEIEAETAKGKIDDGLTPAQKAKKEYIELFGEITDKYNKPEADEYVKKEAYDVLKEDMEYIIGHIQ